MVDRGHSVETAWPIRYGATIVGALWCHWSMGVPLIAQDVTSVLGLAATAAAPAVHDVVERHRTPQLAGALVPDLGRREQRDGNGAAGGVARRGVAVPGARSKGKAGPARSSWPGPSMPRARRRSRRFCALNCAAIADDLVEAELFGHTRGAFTGAVAERLGLFEEAQGGTLFLDEVAELTARVQAKLLRTLQEGEVRRVGESSTRKVDARIVAATNRPLASEAAAGRFRTDLRYRLDVLAHHDSAAARTARGHSAAGASHLVGAGRPHRQPRGAVAIGVVDPRVLRLAGQRSRAPERAGVGHGRRTATRRDRPAEPAGAHDACHGDGARARRSPRPGAISRRATFAPRWRGPAARVMVAARDLGVSRQGLNKLTARLGLTSLEKRIAATH